MIVAAVDNEATAVAETVKKPDTVELFDVAHATAAVVEVATGAA